MPVWNIDPNHTNAEFVARHMMVTNVRGKFTDVSGSIHFDPANPTATSVEVTLSAASITTGAVDRDNHLRSPDFFDVEKYPHLTFRSTRVESTGKNTARLTGDLTIRDVTRSVTLDVEFVGTGKNPWGMTVAGFEASTRINREDFGLTWNVALEAGGVLVGKEIRIELVVQAILAAETQPV
jgi:polyisoprenoid-binding protein YceI